MRHRIPNARSLVGALVLALVTSSASAQIAVEDGFVPVGDGVELYYQKFGDGPPELIVTNQVYTAPSLAGLAADGRTVLFYDTRGRGLSSPVEDPAVLGFEQEIGDIARIQDHFGVERTSVVGWSLWGAFVQLFAARHPDRVERVVAIGPAAPALHPFATMEPLRPGPDVAALERFDVSPYRIGMQMGDDTGWADEEVTVYASPFERCLDGKDLMMPSQLADPSMLPRLARRVCAYPGERNDVILFTLGTIFGSMGDYDWLDAYATIEAPVLIVHGDADTVVVEAIAANRDAVEDARVVVIEDAGHQGFSERPDRYVQVIDAFLRGD